MRIISVLLAVALLFTVMATAERMDEDTVKTLLAEYEPETADTEYYEIYPSNDVYAAWIFCQPEVPDMCNFYQAGTLWYVNDNECIKLGSGDQITSFHILRNVQPEICYCEYIKGEDDCQLQAAYADAETGKCRKLNCGNLIAIEGFEGSIRGMVHKQDYNYAILDTDTTNDTFTEILPVEVSTNEIKESKYADDLKNLYNKFLGVWPDLEIESWYYYSTGMLTLNFQTGGNDWHLYICLSSSEPVIEYDSWEETPIAYEGFATSVRKTNLEASQTRGFMP